MEGVVARGQEVTKKKLWQKAPTRATQPVETATASWFVHPTAPRKHTSSPPPPPSYFLTRQQQQQHHAYCAVLCLDIGRASMKQHTKRF